MPPTPAEEPEPGRKGYINDDNTDKFECDDDPDDEEEQQLWSTSTYYRITRRGKVLKNVSELYLRDDLGLGFCVSDEEGGRGPSSGGKGAVGGGGPTGITTSSDLVSLLSNKKARLPNAGGASSVAGRRRSNRKEEDDRRGESSRIRLVICDANVLLHNMDVLEHPSLAISNVVVPQTALAECRKNSLAQYGRCVDLLRGSDAARRCAIFFPDTYHVETQVSPREERELRCRIRDAQDQEDVTVNDVNDFKLRKVASFYGSHLSGSDVDVILLTDDRRCRELARLEQREVCGDDDGGKPLYRAVSVRELVRDLEGEDPTLSLSDLVAQFSSPFRRPGTTRINAASSSPDGGGRTFFEPHLPLSRILLGVKGGALYQGTIRCADRVSYDRCYVTIRRGDERVAVTVNGLGDVNRAVDGDVVAVQLHPVSEWLTSSSSSTAKSRGDDETSGGDPNGGSKDAKNAAAASEGNVEVIPMATAEPSIRDEDNVQDVVRIPSSGGGEKGEDVSDDLSLRRPTGKVVGIVRRNFRQNYCGSIYARQSLSVENEPAGGVEGEGNREEPSTSDTNVHKQQPGPSKVRTERDAIADQCEAEHPDGSFTCVFFAVDQRVPPVLIRTSQRERLVGQRILVAIDSWPVDSPYPLGHFVRSIGEAGSKDVETEVVLHEYNIPCDPFPAKVLACLPSNDYKITTENSPGRLDLRSLPVLSIDPPGCKDIDDALHCIVLPNGNFQVGVHIADVTHYVEAGSPLDLEAANRSTSTYLVNKRLDMLPTLLTTDLCSLKGNVDRYAFSVLWEVTPDADIVGVDFRKTIIHSIAALTYQQAQGLIDQPDDDGDIQAGAVKRLASLAKKFRQRRIDAGALTLASPEVKFVLDSESLNPTDVQAYALLEANALVEEFMLLANVTVAKKILRHYPTLSILRRHPAPNRAMFDGLIRKAACRGHEIDIDDSKKLADSLDAATIESDPYFNKLLRILSTRCMSPAQYFCSGEYKPTDWHHYGLAAPVYTHFTSPIRRYADVCVHRLLAAAIGVHTLPVRLSSKSYLHDLAANMNRRHRAAQLAGRASVQLHTLVFFSGEDGEKEEDAYILDVDVSEASVPSFTVIVPRYGIEGRVKLSHIEIDDKNLVRDPDKYCLKYKDELSGKVVSTIQVFDKVRVKIWVRVVDDGQKELILDLIGPKFGALSSVEAANMSTLNESNKAKKRLVEVSKDTSVATAKRMK